MKTSPRRRVPLFWLLGVMLLAASAAGAGWVIHTRAGESLGGGKDSAPIASDVTTNCLGQVDVENGVVQLVPQQQYRVTRVLVNESEKVTAGQVLLRLDDRLAREDLDKAERGVKAAEHQLQLARELVKAREREVAGQRLVVESAERDLKLAQRGLSWAEKMYKDKFITEDKVLTAEGLLNRAQLQLDAGKEKLKGLEEAHDAALKVKLAEEDLAVRKADREKARYALELCELKAPEDGLILSVTVNPGDWFGAHSRQPAFVFCPDRPRIIRVEVEQEFAHRVQLNQAATVQDDSSAPDTWRGRVVRVGEWYKSRRSILPDPFPLNDVRTLECIVELDPGQPPLRLGQRVRVTLGR